MTPLMRLVVGLVMLLVGTYLFLDAVHVNNFFSSRFTIFSAGSFRVTPGVVMLPLLVGIFLLFFGSWTRVGVGLIAVSLVILFLGLIMSVNLSLRSMSLFKLLGIIILVMGGVGLMGSVARRDVK
jgi:hypothetical protein